MVAALVTALLCLLLDRVSHESTGTLVLFCVVKTAKVFLVGAAAETANRVNREQQVGCR